ncbi:MAG: hypothetical protein AB8H86_15805 [Polyangiales bacterium]
MNDTPILGPGPHALHWRASLGMRALGLTFMFIGVLVIAGFALAQADNIRALMEESSVWENGAVASDPHVHESWGATGDLIDSYTIPVDWLDESGEFHESEQNFSTFLDGLNGDEPLEVRYVRTDDGYAIATSWSESVRTSRWVASFLIFFFGLVFASLAFLLAFAVMGQTRRTRLTLRDAIEVRLRVVNVISGKSDGSAEHVFVLFDEEKEVELMKRFTKSSPLTLGAAESHVLALRQREGGLLIIHNDLYPLAKDEKSTQEIRTRAAAANLGS